MKYEYKVTQPSPPPTDKRTASDPKSSTMNYQEMTWWMNSMYEQGWEFVGHGTTQLTVSTVQSWWVFKRDKTMFNQHCAIASYE